MKKILFFMLIFFCNVYVVFAKDIAMTCVYNNDASISGDPNWKVGIRCVIYNNYSHQCYVERGSDDASVDSNKESILNWTDSRGLGWTAKNEIYRYKRCPEHVVFSLQTTTGMKVYAAKDTSMAHDFLNKLGTTYKYYIATLSKEYRGVLFDGETSSEEEEKPSEPSYTDPDYKITDTDVQTVCSSPSYRKPAKFVGTIVNFLRIIIPIVIIVMGIMDLYKGVTGAKDDALKKSVKSLGLRAIAGVAIFLLPGLVLLVLSLINEWSDYKNTWCCCAECILNSDCDTSTCNSDSCRIEGTD